MFPLAIDSRPERIVVINGSKWMSADIACAQYRPEYTGPPCGVCDACAIFVYAGAQDGLLIPDYSETWQPPSLWYSLRIHDGRTHSYSFDCETYGIESPIMYHANFEQTVWRLLGNDMVQEAVDRDLLRVDAVKVQAITKLLREVYPELGCPSEYPFTKIPEDRRRVPPAWLTNLNSYYCEPFHALLTIATSWGAFTQDGLHPDFYDDVLTELLYDAYAIYTKEEHERRWDDTLLKPYLARKHPPESLSGWISLDDRRSKQLDADYIDPQQYRSVSRAFVERARKALKRTESRKEREYILKHGFPYDESDPGWDFSLNVFQDGDSDCPRFVITGSDGRWSWDGGDGRCTPIFSRCGVRIEGDSYTSLTTYRCERHGATTLAL